MATQKELEVLAKSAHTVIRDKDGKIVKLIRCRETVVEPDEKGNNIRRHQGKEEVIEAPKRKGNPYQGEGGKFSSAADDADGTPRYEPKKEGD